VKLILLLGPVGLDFQSDGRVVQRRRGSCDASAGGGQPRLAVNWLEVVPLKFTGEIRPSEE
jgi:hypothetical protein